MVLPGDDSKPVPFVQTGFNEEQGRFSPNGRWVAYVSNQSGLSEVYVREFATDFSSGSASRGGSVLVSHGGGTAPRWRGDGRELFYLAPNGKMMAVDVIAGQEFPRRDADAALSGAARRGRRRRDRGRQAISPRDAGRAQRIGAVHGRVELERRAEAARADQVDERTGTGLRREVLIQPLRNSGELKAARRTDPRRSGSYDRESEG